MTEALQSYTILSIGDGLVSQIPAIIISIAAGILVTRSSDEANLGEFVGKQLTIYPRAIAISGFLLLLFSVFLSETFWPFFILSVACFGLSYILSKKAKEESTMEEVNPALPHAVAGSGGTNHHILVILPNNPQVLQMLCQAVQLPWKRPLNRKFLLWKWDMVC